LVSAAIPGRESWIFLTKGVLIRNTAPKGKSMELSGR
jgi:hypothetical protein